MPWTTPTLKQVRSTVRDYIRGALPGADASVPNSVLRVVSDAQGGLCHLTLQYIDWLALQLLPDTAETEWLDRHGDIWLVNADGTTGRKNATFAFGQVTVTGVEGSILPTGTRMTNTLGIEYETIEEVIVGLEPTPVNIRALDPGSAGNVEPGDTLGFSQAIPAGIDNTVTVTVLAGGVNAESDDLLRERVLERIRNPPMGGDEADYVAWTKSIPGVTRAWCAPLEMGIGTVTVRFMMDELRPSDNGIPSSEDVATVAAILDTLRPVAVKDFFVQAPIPFLMDYHITDLERDDVAVHNAIRASVERMFYKRAKPGQTIYKSWMMEAISGAAGEEHHDLTEGNIAMPSAGHMPILGEIIYGVG